MLGEGRFVERLDVLEYFALDKFVSLYPKRCAQSIATTESFLSSIIDVLLEGLHDPYFESVTAFFLLWRQLIKQFHEESRPFLERVDTAVRPFVSSKTHDVQMYALQVLTETTSSFADIEKDFQRNYFHPNWKVRHGIVCCFGRLIERGLLNPDRVAKELEGFLQTSNGFNMHFVLKKRNP